MSKKKDKEEEEIRDNLFVSRFFMIIASILIYIIGWFCDDPYIEEYGQTRIVSIEQLDYNNHKIRVVFVSSNYRDKVKEIHLIRHHYGDLKVGDSITQRMLDENTTFDP